jgi:hypothetical protein
VSEDAGEKVSPGLEHPRKCSITSEFHNGTTGTVFITERFFLCVKSELLRLNIDSGGQK